MQDAPWFKVDAYKRKDKKYRPIWAHFGIEGYGVCDVVLEMFRESSNFKLPNSDETYIDIAFETQCKVERIREIMDIACKGNKPLFRRDADWIWSDRFLRDMEHMIATRKSRSAAAYQNWARRKAPVEQPAGRPLGDARKVFKGTRRAKPTVIGQVMEEMGK